MGHLLKEIGEFASQLWKHVKLKALIYIKVEALILKMLFDELFGLELIANGVRVQKRFEGEEHAFSF